MFIVRGRETDNVYTLGCTPTVCQTRKQGHQLTGLRGDRDVHAVDGPLKLSASVGRGEVHVTGPGEPTCVDREVFSSNIKSFLYHNILLSPFLPFHLLCFRSPFPGNRKIQCGGHTDVSEYESPMNISLNVVLRRTVDNPDIPLSHNKTGSFFTDGGVDLP